MSVSGYIEGLLWGDINYAKKNVTRWLFYVRQNERPLDMDETTP
ncbi:hypothetical protein CPter91_3435 [Collimonas pratensis]|uniref:Uncharacterized protein n=1 Tax=Collimonas pratensis TaxID=279113 RepID=A0A127Q6V3_9BURK|nr:hypothetical protein CPter91_3435 [Collimonas pratensis]